MTNRLIDEHCAKCQKYLFSHSYGSTGAGKAHYCKGHEPKKRKAKSTKKK